MIIKHTKTNKNKQSLKYSSRYSKKVSSDPDIRVFSYNVSWESLSGKKSDWELCNNASNSNHPRHHSVCTGNISQVINENPTDFITLQEAGEYHKLIKQSPRMQNMEYRTHESGLDLVITFWEKKYKLINQLTGEFEKGRPWLACFLKYNSMGKNMIIAVVNVHFGHYTEEEEIEKINGMIGDIKTYCKNEKIDVKRFILAGDFNYDIKKITSDRSDRDDSNDNIIMSNGIKFHYHPKHVLTCCIRRRRHYDHVMDSKSQPLDIIIPDVHYMASDHKPIIVKLVK